MEKCFDLIDLVDHDLRTWTEFKRLFGAVLHRAPPMWDMSLDDMLKVALWIYYRVVPFDLGMQILVSQGYSNSNVVLGGF